MRKFLRRLFSTRIMSEGRYFANPAKDPNPSEDTRPLPVSALVPALDDVLHRITVGLAPVPRNGGDGLYLGTAGVAYAFYHLAKIEQLGDRRESYLKHAADYLKPALQVCSKSCTRARDVPSFLLGNGGVYAVAAAVYNSRFEFAESSTYLKLYEDAGKICTNMEFLSCGSDELFVGRAGYLCGALWLQRELNHKFDQDRLYEITRVMIESGRRYSQRRRSPSPLMYAYYDVEYLGAGHGLCSILFYAMCVPGFLEANPRDARDIKASVDYLLSVRDSAGNLPAATDELNTGPNELVHWCHGAPGAAYLFAKAHLVWREDKYLEGVKTFGELIWKKGLLKKGPGLCHGVAGNGYVFLLLYRLTGDKVHLHRANAFFDFMNSEDFTKRARVPDNPYSLYEGLAGTACFIGDLACPENAHFPFSDVF